MALALVVGGCGSSRVPITAVPVVTTAPPTTAAPIHVDVAVAGCSAPPVTFALLCEVSDLLHSYHLNPPTDAALASAALEGLNSYQSDEVEELPRAITCAVPAESFVPFCERVAERMEQEGTPLGPLVESAVYGMLAGTVDPYTVYVPPELSGAIGEDGIIPGVGMVVAALTVAGSPCARIEGVCPLRVVTVLGGSPAEQAGLVAGDEIRAVDGAPVMGRALIEIAAAINGEPGTTVVLDVARQGTELRLELERGAADAIPVSIELIGTTGYIRLPEFGAFTHLEFHHLLQALIEGGARRLVLDLRDNPGGYLYSVSIIGSEFFSSGLLYRTQSPAESLDYPAVEGGIATRLPVIALVNGSSASAAEILAAVLKERGRAVLVGSPTFGKNLVQVPFELHNGGYLRVTTAEWTTPDGVSVAQSGVAPDFSVELGPELTVEELVEAALAAAG